MMMVTHKGMIRNDKVGGDRVQADSSASNWHKRWQNGCGLSISLFGMEGNMSESGCGSVVKRVGHIPDWGMRILGTLFGLGSS